MRNAHDEIISILLKLCKSYKGYKKSYRGSKKHRLAFATPRCGKPISKQYQPDVIAEWRRGRYIDIFEVWHSEPEVEAVLDILYPALHRAQSKEIKNLCIVCTGYNLGEEEANNLKNLILDNLRDKEGNKLFFDDEVLVAEIPKNIRKDRLKIEKYLEQKLKF